MKRESESPESGPYLDVAAAGAALDRLPADRDSTRKLKEEIRLLRDELQSLYSSPAWRLIFSYRRWLRRTAEHWPGLHRLYASLADRLAVMRQGEVVQIGNPRAVYRAPASRFVADFIGETNWLPAEVLHRAPEGLSLRTECGDFVSASNQSRRSPGLRIRRTTPQCSSSESAMEAAPEEMES